MSMESYVMIGGWIFVLVLMLWMWFSGREKQKLKKTIVQNIKHLQNIFDVSHDGVMFLSDTNQIMYANKVMIKLLHLKEDFLKTPLASIPEVYIKRNWVALDALIVQSAKSLEERVLFVPRTRVKGIGVEESEINLYIDKIERGKPSDKCCHIITIQDLNQEKEIYLQKHIHQLTHLPNQQQALEDLPALYAKVHKNNKKTALVLMSLDNFTMLRSVIGYEKANQLLITFSHYLEKITKGLKVQMYHTFENHFLVTLSNLNSLDEVQKLVEEIQFELASTYRLQNISLNLTLSAGIAVYPDSGTTRDLLDNAYKALAHAEEEGDGRIYTHLLSKSEQKYDPLTLHHDMQGGLERGEFEVYYQPIVEVSTKEVVAAEALIRWNHPEHGMIPPDMFIALMEQTGVIIQLGKFILAQVLKQQKLWESFGFKEVEISINVSMVEIATGEFVQHVEKQLKSYNVSPSLIKFEITEGMAMKGEAETKKYFLALKKLGVGLSLDDFGTGYTSFSYLKKFPANVLKIDKSLVDNILTDAKDQGIVKAIIGLAHNLGVKIVVEGVETQKMVDILEAYGCDYMQGYFFAKPLQLFEFQKFLRVAKPTPTSLQEEEDEGLMQIDDEDNLSLDDEYLV